MECHYVGRWFVVESRDFAFAEKCSLSSNRRIITDQIKAKFSAIFQVLLLRVASEEGEASSEGRRLKQVPVDRIGVNE